MKIFTKKSFVQKIVLSLVILISMTTIVPNYSYCAVWDDIGSALLKEIVQLIASLGDAVMGALNGIMLDTGGFGSAMLSVNNDNLKEGSGSWLSTAPDNAKISEVNIGTGEIDESGLFGSGSYQVPNMLYSPENIFANKIGAFDINFLNPNKYISAKNGNAVEYDENVDVKDQDQISGAAVLRSTIATWYRSFRNIAIVGLLSVLIYLGIRILISTTANDKAKYKENLKDWLVALCLVFFMHFIMAGIIMIAEKFTELFTSSTGIIQVNFGGVESGKFYTNLMGLVRFRAQSTEWQEAAAYTIMYLALVIYTCIFTFIYFKRFLYTAFFTMISPLVALTYPIDKAGDKKAQAFSMWLKEYTMNVIIQPVHLLLYTALITTAMDLVSANPIYGLVAIAFLIPAEKFIKKMFGIESESSSGFASFAGGALAMKALSKLSSGGSKKGSSGGGQKDSDGAGKDKVRMQNNGELGNLSTFNDDTQSEEDGNNPRLINANEQNEEAQRQEALDRYNAEGFGQNANGEYYNPWTDEYDADYDPTKDSSYLPKTENKDTENINDEQSINTNNEIKPSRMDRAKRTIKGIAPYARLGGKALRFTGRALTRGAAMVAGGGIGLAAGLTTGDMSKAFTYTATGALAGKAIRDKVARAPGAVKDMAVGTRDKIREELDKANDEKVENTQGYAAMRAQQIARDNARARAAILKNKDEIRKYKQMAGDIGYDGDIKNFMNAALDYKEAGVEDDKLIKNALKLENKNGGVGGNKHKNIVDVTSFTKDYGRDYIEDEKKRASLEKVVNSKVSNQNSQKEIMKTFAALHGRDKL